jgi:hypothetical protein
MTRVESSEEITEPAVKKVSEPQKNDVDASEYFVVDKNLSSLDIYSRSEFNQMVQPAQLASNQTTSERESVLPHPLKNKLLSEA